MFKLVGEDIVGWTCTNKYNLLKHFSKRNNVEVFKGKGGH